MIPDKANLANVLTALLIVFAVCAIARLCGCGVAWGMENYTSPDNTVTMTITTPRCPDGTLATLTANSFNPNVGGWFCGKRKIEPVPCPELWQFAEPRKGEQPWTVK